MSKYITVVLKYEKGQEQPGFGAGMKVLGGSVDSVQFDHALTEFEKMHEELTQTKERLAEAEKIISRMELVWKQGFDSECYNEKDFCDDLIIADNFLDNKQEGE